MVRSYGSLTPFGINSTRSVKREPADLATLVGASRPKADLRFTVLGRVPSGDAEIEALEVASAPGVQVPAWMFLPRKQNPGGAVYLLLEPGGRGRWREGDLYQSLAAQGHIVCAADLRGIGDLMPELGRGSARYARDHGDDESYAWASLILGRSLVGQRVTDLLAVAAALHARPEAKGRQLIVAARGKTTVPAQIAAGSTPPSIASTSPKGWSRSRAWSGPRTTAPSSRTSCRACCSIPTCRKSPHPCGPDGRLGRLRHGLRRPGRSAGNPASVP